MDAFVRPAEKPIVTALNKIRCCLALALLGAGWVLHGGEAVTVRSRSGQFTVYADRQILAQALPGKLGSVPLGQGHLFWFTPEKSTNDVARVRLVPSLTAVSCERLKEALHEELGRPAAPGGKVHLILSSQTGPDTIRFLAGPSPRGWIYTLELPIEMDAQQFTAVVLQALMTDLAHTANDQEQIEIPMWLLLGMTAHLQATTLESFALHPNWQMTRDKVRPTASADLRERFSRELPLTFDQLSWPENLSPDQAGLFRDSSHLLVGELLRLKGGREGLARFLTLLPRHKNWQFAFLEAFHGQFEALVDVEKWWALRFSTLGGRNLANLWSAEESWSRLKAALDIPVQIHLDANRLPVEGKISLQEVLGQWDAARQEMALRKTVSQLRYLRLRVQPELVGLVDDYRKVLENHLEGRAKSGSSKLRGEPAALNSVVWKKATLRQLDLLDEQRVRLRQKMQTAADAPNQVPQNNPAGN